MDSVKGYLIEASGITLVFQFAFLYSHFRIIFHMQFHLLSSQNSQGFQLLFNLQIPSKFPPNFSMFSTANQPWFSFTLWYFVVVNKPFISLHSHLTIHIIYPWCSSDLHVNFIHITGVNTISWLDSLHISPVLHSNSFWIYLIKFVFK